MERVYFILQLVVHHDRKLGRELKGLESGTEKEAMKDVEKDYHDGFQGWEYKFNTVASSRGDYPFITVTMGLGTGKFERMASKVMLEVRGAGQGKKENKISKKK